MFDPKPSRNFREGNLKRAGAFRDLEEMEKIRKRHILAAVLLFVIGLVLIVPLHVLLLETADLSARASAALYYFTDFIQALDPRSPIGPIDWFLSYPYWYATGVYQGIVHAVDPGAAAGIPPWKSLLALGTWGLLVAIPIMRMDARLAGLSDTPNIFGDTRWADEKDIERMSRKDLVGFDGKLFVVGKLKNKLIRMKETLSVLLLAPPGTGKTVAFIVPSAVMMDETCQMINDQKPELFYMTSGHRSTLGPVFQIMWSAQDMPDGGWMTEDQVSLINPDLIERDETGEFIRDASGNYKVKPIFYPSWNPIGPASIPAPGPKRDLYIERLASILSSDTQGTDAFWTSKARDALIGLVHYLVAKTEMGQSPLYPEIDETGIPKQWQGKEASFPMLIDWFTEAQNAVEDIESDDPMRELFKAAIRDARRMNDVYLERHGYAVMNRAIAELTALMNSPDKTRGSILTTLDNALAPFKNEAVRQRTSRSTFSFNELRGRPRKEARDREEKKRQEAAARGEIYHPRYARDEWEPITIYISINAEDAKAFATITGVFVDSANAYLVANGPNAIDDRGNQLGPYDFFFLLDETPTLPKLTTVMEGPAVGRSKRVSYAIVGQDFAQIESRYSSSEVETIKSTTAIKVVLSQNNEKAARAISEMAGSMTYMKANFTKKDFGDPITKFLGMKKEVISGTSWEKREFIDTSFVMAMPEDKHVVLVQNFMNRPILAETPKFFLQPEIRERVFNLRTGEGPKPALPMPRDLFEVAAQSKVEEEENRQRAKQVATAESNPVVAVIVTPQNISDTSRDLNSADVVNLVPPGNQFAVCLVEIDDSDYYIKMPEDEDIKVVTEADEMASLLENRRVIVFSDADREAVQQLLGERNPVLPELWQEIRPDALRIEEWDDGDFFTVGYDGLARTDPPRSGEGATPHFAMRWMLEILSTVHSYNLQARRISLGAD